VAKLTNWISRCRGKNRNSVLVAARTERELSARKKAQHPLFSDGSLVAARTEREPSARKKAQHPLFSDGSRMALVAARVERKRSARKPNVLCWIQDDTSYGANREETQC
jgi:hypothetical protein